MGLAEPILSSLQALKQKAKEDIENSKSSFDLEQVRLQLLGKKGAVTAALTQLKDLTPEERKEVGKVANDLKTELEKALNEKLKVFKKEELEQKLLKDDLDATAPGVFFPQGSLHPIRLVLREAVSLFKLAGLLPAYGPEVEYEDYCFDKLNFKKGHAARDMQATFFVKNTDIDSSGRRPLVLRTHTSPVQVRVLLEIARRNFSLPIRIQVPGRVYRVDDDPTHAPMFHQIEGLAIDRVMSMGDLRAVLDFFFRHFFDSKTKIRFRPSYFPFTEPSAEVDVSCVFCKGQGCRVCGQSGWLEVAGAGLVHPEVFSACGWNPEEVQGWAFGMGIERLTMLKFGISDLRLFFENRLSFLRGKTA